MRIFNSLGSNYTFGFALRSLLAIGQKKQQQALITFLEHKYGGKAYLTYKGRQAIELALKFSDHPQAHVAFLGFTCFAVYKAIQDQTHPVHYMDTSSTSLQFSAHALRQAVSDNPLIKIVIIQNTLGYVCDIQGIKAVCQEKDLILIEDLAHSIGSQYASGEEAGTVGDFVILSFSQDKVVDAVSGGALIIRNQQYAKKIDMHFAQVPLVKQLQDRLYPILTVAIRNTYSIFLGKLLHRLCKQLHLLPKPVAGNLGGGIQLLPSWYAQLVHRQFHTLTSQLQHRQQIAEIYATQLTPGLLIHEVVQTRSHSTNLRFPIRVPRRAELITHLQSKGVYISDIWYDAPIAPQKYMHLTDYAHQCPNAEQLSSTILNLPTHINISAQQAQRVVVALNQWMEHNV